VRPCEIRVGNTYISEGGNSWIVVEERGSEIFVMRTSGKRRAFAIERSEFARLMVREEATHDAAS
jgi:hypothetical protein